MPHANQRFLPPPEAIRQSTTASDHPAENRHDRRSARAKRNRPEGTRLVCGAGVPARQRRAALAGGRGTSHQVAQDWLHRHRAVTAKAQASLPMHKHQNTLPPLAQRCISSPRPERLADAMVVLMPPVEAVVKSLPGFIGPQFERPVTLPVLLVSPMTLLPEQAGTPTLLVHAIPLPRYNAHSRWGLNE